jgi:hypothetical protein
VVVLTDAGSQLGTAHETYIASLQETGFLHAGAFGVVDLSQIPEGLNAQEKEGSVREKGEGSRSAQRPTHPVLSVVLDQA